MGCGVIVLWGIVKQLAACLWFGSLGRGGGQVFLLRMTRAPITPGTQPHRVKIVTMSTEPQPRSMTASGGKMMDSNTLKQDIGLIGFGLYPTMAKNVPCRHPRGSATSSTGRRATEVVPKM